VCLCYLALFMRVGLPCRCMPRCPNCGEWVDENERFCDQCGLKIPDDTTGDRWERETFGGDSSDREHDPEEMRRRQRTRAADEDVPLPEREPGLEYVLRHPLRRGRRPLLVTAALLLGSFLVVPVLLLAGYSYRLGRSVVAEAEEPPEYSNLGELIMDGTRLVIVTSLPTLLWSIGTLLVVGILLVAVPAANGLAPLVTGLSAAALLWFVGTFVVAFVGGDSVVGAFVDGRARALRFDPIYLRNWLLVLASTVVLLVALTVVIGPMFVLAAIGLPTFVLVPLWPIALAGGAVVLAYGLLTGITYAGYVYYGAAGRGIVPAPEERTEMGLGLPGLEQETE
jgi:hypothetical protein